MLMSCVSRARPSSSLRLRSMKLGLSDQVSRREAAQRELREDHHLGARTPGPCAEFTYSGQVCRKVADGGVDLCQCDFHETLFQVGIIADFALSWADLKPRPRDLAGLAGVFMCRYLGYDARAEKNGGLEQVMAKENDERMPDERRAIEYFERAYAHQRNGDLEKAIELYKESIAILPTAEAHTFSAGRTVFKTATMKPSKSVIVRLRSIPTSEIPTTISART